MSSARYVFVTQGSLNEGSCTEEIKVINRISSNIEIPVTSVLLSVICKLTYVHMDVYVPTNTSEKCIMTCKYWIFWNKQFFKNHVFLLSLL